MLKAFDPTWTELFEQERKILLDNLSEFITAVHHVGSTAVPELVSRPLVDIAVESHTSPPDSIAYDILLSLGYFPVSENEYGLGFCYIKGKEEGFFLFWNTIGSLGIAKQLYFRNLLKSNLGLIKKYNDLKRSLAEEYRYEVNLYHEQKSHLSK